MARRAADDAPSGGWRPEERLTFEEALAGYAVGNAQAGGVARRRGVLAPGYDADLVAWEADPALEAGVAEAFREARACLTVVGGGVVMRS
jgi:predicted amidohydrolase YtcJ